MPPHAVVNPRIWHDEDWWDLSSAAQHLWFLLVSQQQRPLLYDPAAWAALSRGATVEDRVLAFVELEAMGWVTEVFGTVDFTRRDYIVRLPRNPHARASIPSSLRRQVFERDGHACVTCGTSERLSVDHIVPWSKGGPDTLDNFQTLCVPCNARKKDRV